MNFVWPTRLNATSKVNKWLIVAGAVILLVIFSVVLKSCYDKDVIDDHVTKQNEKVLEKTVKSNDKAAEQRAKDAVKNQRDEEEKLDAIAKESDGAPSDASIALSCVRLRNAGYDTSGISACRGR